MTKLMKKSVLLILTMLVLMAVGSVAAYADITPEKPTTGEGTEGKPYKIGTAAELCWFVGLVNGTFTDGTEQNTDACAVLTKDIVINTGTFDEDGTYTPQDSETANQWIPIGNYDNQYTGTFDGNDKTISGLYVNSNDNYAGLFGRVGENGKIQNVGVDDSYISSSSSKYYIYIGCVCGWNEGTIKNCYNTGTVNGNSNNYKSNVGGLCGYVYSGTITNCYFLTGTAISGIGSNSGTVNNVEAKTIVHFLPARWRGCLIMTRSRSLGDRVQQIIYLFC